MRLIVGLVGAILLLTPTVLAISSGDCTITGTRSRDILRGTSDADVICSKAGNDYANGDAGNDLILGDGGKDTLVGGDGKDEIRGNKGSDIIFAIDDRGGDDIYAGPGHDLCFVDNGDHAESCENLRGEP